MPDNTAEEIKNIRKANFPDDPENPNQLPLIEDELKIRIRTVKRETYEIGRLLTDAKKIVGHGNFQNWVKEKFGFSPQTANNFMNVYKVCIGRQWLAETFPPSILYTIAAPACPKELCEYLLKDGDPDLLKNKEIKRIIKRFVNKEIGLDSPEIKAFSKYDSDMDDYRRYDNQINENLISLNKFRITALNLTRGSDWPIYQDNRKTTLTNEQADQLETLRKDLERVQNEIFPDYEIIDVEPQLKAPKAKARVLKKLKIRNI